MSQQFFATVVVFLRYYKREKQMYMQTFIKIHRSTEEKTNREQTFIKCFKVL